MTRKDWAEIIKAAKVLGLGEKASLAELKRSYRKLSKRYHPDMRQGQAGKSESKEMHELSEAYQLLLDYFTEYRFPLMPGDKDEQAAEDWWFERFGRDHHWGRGAVPDEEI